MMDAGRHPRIELLVDSEVEDITGFVGNYNALVRRRARFVDTDECTSCGECEKVCPVIVPDEYQEGLSSRKAIYLPFPQAVPSAFSLDVESCLGFNPIACGKCLEVCDKKCIDFDATDEFLDLEVGTVVVATGMEVYDPRENDEYGYTRFPNVVTSMEFERLINAGGPTDGELVRPSDRAVPLRVGFIQCVGSRSVQRGVPYCSNICCMNTIKETLLLADHYPESRSTVYYMDIRAFGKGFEDLYRRSREAGVRYIRGLPGTVKEAPGSSDLIVEVENTLTGTMEEHRLDMLVLAVGMVPRRANGNGKRSIDEILSLSHTSDGFVMEAHPKLKPVDAPTRGVYFAGCVESPKDVKDSVTQAGAAAGRAGQPVGCRPGANRGHYGDPGCGPLSALHHLCSGLSVSRHRAGRQEEGSSAAVCRSGLRRLWYLRGRVSIRCHRHASLRRPTGPGADRRHSGRRSHAEDCRLRL